MFRIVRPGISAFGALLGGLILSSCKDEAIYTDLRIYSSPYAEVNWTESYRLKAQHHDHIGISVTRIRAYDAAGYDAIGLMDYSGRPSQVGAWLQRIWPPELWLSPALLSSLQNIEFFIPNAEEVGIEQHATSPFLTTYIEGVASSPRIRPEDWQYTSISEMFDLIRANDGFPCLAHPWGYNYSFFEGPYCVEIYSAQAEARRLQGEAGFADWDRNVTLLNNWDLALQNNQQALGIAVNDHFGPSRTDAAASAIDSGKIIVLAESPTLAAYREAFENGAIFAIRDNAITKDLYPIVFSITVDQEAIAIETDGNVRWVSYGLTIGNDAVLPRGDLPPNARYVRAEIANAGGEATVYTQAFPVRPVGDVNGDYRIDSTDDEICSSLELEDNFDNASNVFVAACEARNVE